MHKVDLSAGTIDASGCPGLTSLEAPNATAIYAIGCTGLTSLEAPNATTIYARGCTGLTSLEAPNATAIYASGCPGLTSQWKKTRLIPLLRATGKSVAEVVKIHWECHEWSNCPMHGVFGVKSVSEVPREWQFDASWFVSVFDAAELPADEVLALAESAAV